MRQIVIPNDKVTSLNEVGIEKLSVCYARTFCICQHICPLAKHSSEGQDQALSGKNKETHRYALDEKIEKCYEEDKVRCLLHALDTVPPPSGWNESNGHSHKKVFDWKALTVILTLMLRRGFTFEEMSAHLEHDRWLLGILRLPKAPAKSTLQRARKLIPNNWLNEVNRAVLREKSRCDMDGLSNLVESLD
ncbi:hypothetical protein [Methanomassiliicoccus luminyensis]|uniref:hypothetical protein n=1 Tax=Methanomassiliicoccus luminyensis TaxID=1080712 RepID=UPI00036C50CB|nr:hypothetical protein [Methanomassiliicoccus luminyensis]